MGWRILVGGVAWCGVAILFHPLVLHDGVVDHPPVACPIKKKGGLSIACRGRLSIDPGRWTAVRVRLYYSYTS
jgi:hypothetical protein